VTETSSVVAWAGAGAADTELGRTVMIGVPVRTRDRTTTAPPKTLCVAVPSASTPTASVRMPLRVFIASRAATSLPSAEEVTSTAAGDAADTS
jgi:hypothetical protein